MKTHPCTIGELGLYKSDSASVAVTPAAGDDAAASGDAAATGDAATTGDATAPDTAAADLAPTDDIATNGDRRLANEDPYVVRNDTFF